MKRAEPYAEDVGKESEKITTGWRSTPVSRRRYRRGGLE